MRFLIKLTLATALLIHNSCTKLTHDCTCGPTCTCPGCCCDERCEDEKPKIPLVGLPEMRPIQEHQN